MTTRFLFKVTLEAQIIPYGACAMWSVPPLLRDFAGIFARFGNLELGWEKSDHHDDTWHCGTGHKRKRTGLQAIARSKEH